MYEKERKVALKILERYGVSTLPSFKLFLVREAVKTCVHRGTNKPYTTIYLGVEEESKKAQRTIKNIKKIIKCKTVEDFPFWVFALYHEIGHLNTYDPTEYKERKAKENSFIMFRAEVDCLSFEDEEDSFTISQKYREIPTEKLADHWALITMEKDKIFISKIFKEEGLAC